MNTKQYAQIVEWLYVNNNNFDSGSEWKGELLIMLKDVLGFDGDWDNDDLHDDEDCDCNRVTCNFCKGDPKNSCCGFCGGVPVRYVNGSCTCKSCR